MPKMVTREKSDYGRKVQEKAVIEKVIIAIIYFAFFGSEMSLMSTVVEVLVEKIIGCICYNAVQNISEYKNIKE